MRTAQALAANRWAIGCPSGLALSVFPEGGLRGEKNLLSVFHLFFHPVLHPSFPFLCFGPLVVRSWSARGPLVVRFVVRFVVRYPVTVALFHRNYR
jgi:hypothetical protein